jgi:hypothetical protein
MIWYILGGLIGLIFFKKKYNLSFWKSVSLGIGFAFGLYFSFGTIIALLSITLVLEEYTNTTLLGFIINAILATVCFIGVKFFIRQEKNRNSENKGKSLEFYANSSSQVNNLKINPGDTIETSVVGVTFEGRQEIINSLHVGQPIKLVREPENEHDINAIQVMVSNKETIGYIYKDLAKRIAPIFDKYFQSEIIYGEIVSIYRVKNRPSIKGVKIRFKLFNMKDNN